MRNHALAIWQAALDAARPEPVIARALTDPASPLALALRDAKRILVVGAGKAGSAMVRAVEQTLHDRLDAISGIVNIPDSGDKLPAQSAIVLHPARPQGSNHPTAQGVVGADCMLELMHSAGPDDVALCLLSGGGSALLPAPVAGVPLEDKQNVTRLLHACGATINEMNAVRKHLSRIKGGRLAQAFGGKAMFSLILSDVIGDPLDVIASGPTAADPSTFADALEVLVRHDLLGRAPQTVVKHLEAGNRGEIPETCKSVPANVHNLVVGSNRHALEASAAKAQSLGYRVLNLGSFIEGETRQVAIALAGIVRSIRRDGVPLASPACILSGGETTVHLETGHGKGGRNQEFVLAAAHYLGESELRDVVILSGGTDGEDGPTDAAGAIADARTLVLARTQGLNAKDHLDRHDAYPFFDTTGDLLKTGLTETNVMDVRFFLMR